MSPSCTTASVYWWKGPSPTITAWTSVFVLAYVHSGGTWGDKVREHISHSHDRHITLSRV